MKKEDFTPSAGLLQATATYVMAIAYTQAIRPKIEDIQKSILLAHEYRCAHDGKLITDPAHVFAMPDTDFAHYARLLDEAYAKAGYVLEPGTCPLLIAENLERQARDIMIKMSAELKTGVDLDGLYRNMKWLEEYTQILLKLLVPKIDPSLLKVPKPGEI